jgi:hypothetical protein
MYSVMAIFKSSIVWGLFEYTEFLYCNHQVLREFLDTLYMRYRYEFDISGLKMTELDRNMSLQ